MMGAMASPTGRRLAAIDRAMTALRDWIADERTAAEQRHRGAADEDALDAAVLADPAYSEGLAAWHNATEALRAVRPLMAPATAPDGETR